MYNLNLSHNLSRPLYITTAVVIVFSIATSAYLVANASPSKTTHSANHMNNLPQQDNNTVILNAPADVPAKESALIIVKEIRAYRGVDDATAGKLHSKVMTKIEHERSLGYVDTPFDQASIDDLMLNSYVYPEERNYWATYFSSL